MKLLIRAVLVCIVLIVGAKLFHDRWHLAKTQKAERELTNCITQMVEPALKQDFTQTNESLIHSAISGCQIKYDRVADSCSTKSNCEITAKKIVSRRINLIREELRFMREEARKRQLIESTIKKLEEAGIDRDDIKSFFRNEILEEESEDRNAAAEASDSNDRERPGRFGW